MSGFDPQRASLSGPDLFPRFRVQGEGAPLSELGLAEDVELIVAERHGQRAGFVVRELALPHVAEGKLAGQPYLVSF